MKKLKLLIPPNLLKLSMGKFECQIQKTLTEMTIKLDKLLSNTKLIKIKRNLRLLSKVF